MVKCSVCGATENLQEHHLSYEPEIKIPICVSCHKKVHKRGVGAATGTTHPLLSKNKARFIDLWNEGGTIKQIAKEFNVSSGTIQRWRKKLELGPNKVPQHFTIEVTDEELAIQFRLTVVREYGQYRGNVSKAFAEAMRDWVKKKEAEQ